MSGERMTLSFFAFTGARCAKISLVTLSSMLEQIGQFSSEAFKRLLLLCRVSEDTTTKVWIGALKLETVQAFLKLLTMQSLDFIKNRNKEKGTQDEKRVES